MAVTQQQLGERIRVARERFHLTPEELGEFVGLSAEAIGEIERGERDVGFSGLDRIAYAVGRNVWEFNQPEFEDSGALSALFWANRACADRRLTTVALQEGLAFALQFSSLERLLKIDRGERLPQALVLPSPGSIEEAIHQGEEVASAERLRLDLGAMSIFRPQHLLETQGVGSMAAALPADVSGLMLFEPRIGAFVFVNAAQPSTRRRFSLAHEYGHALMDRHRLACLSTVGAGEDLIERRANAFAAGFLMPRDLVARYVESGPNCQGNVPRILAAARVAQECGVSRRSAVVRLKHLHLISDDDCRQIEQEEASGVGRQCTTMMSLFNPPDDDSRRESRGRLLSLAFECYRNERISTRKLKGIGRRFGVEEDLITLMIDAFGMEH